MSINKELNEEIKSNIDAITLGIISEQERTGKTITPFEIANLMMVFSLNQTAGWLHNTLADSPDFRYSLALLLEQQAALLSKYKGD